MKNFYIAGVFLFFAFGSNQAFSANSSKTSKWVYDKTSETNILGQKDVNIIAHLNRDYENITIMMDNKMLLIKDSALEDGDICSPAYIEIKKTPLSYYLSQKSVDIYKGIFNRSHRALPENLYILESIYPG